MSWQRLASLAAVVGLTVAIGAVRLDRIDTPGERLRDGPPIAGAAHLAERPRPGPFGVPLRAKRTQ